MPVLSLTYYFMYALTYVWHIRNHKRNTKGFYHAKLVNLKVITCFSINDKYGPSFQVDPDPNECIITNFDKFKNAFLSSSGAKLVIPLVFYSESSCFLRRPHKLTKSLPPIWLYVVSVKLTVKISLIFVAFLENANFNIYWYNLQTILFHAYCCLLNAGLIIEVTLSNCIIINHFREIYSNYTFLSNLKVFSNLITYQSSSLFSPCLLHM